MFPPSKRRRYLSTSARASQACQGCAVSKVKCDNLKTCRRCEQRHIECVRSPPSRLPSLEADSLIVEVSSQPPQSRSARKTPPPGTGTKALPQHVNEQGSLNFTPTCKSCLLPDWAQGTVHSDVSDCFRPLAPTSSSSAPWLHANDLFNIWNSIPPPQTEPLSSETLLDLNFQELGTEARGSGPVPEVLPKSVFINVSEVTAEVKRTFNLSLGSWRPDDTDYLLADELSLFVRPHEKLRADDILGVYDNTILWERLTEDTRDQILLMTQNISQERSGANLSSRRTFPALDVLDKLLRFFLTLHRAESIPFIHIPTFRPSFNDLVLVTGCIAAGAARSKNPRARKFGLALMEVVRLQIAREVSCTLTDSMTRHRRSEVVPHRLMATLAVQSDYESDSSAGEHAGLCPASQCRPVERRCAAP